MPDTPNLADALSSKLEALTGPESPFARQQRDLSELQRELDALGGLADNSPEHLHRIQAAMQRWTLANQLMAEQQRQMAETVKGIIAKM